jgi:hypothetical protein
MNISGVKGKVFNLLLGCQKTVRRRKFGLQRALLSPRTTRAMWKDVLMFEYGSTSTLGVDLEVVVFSPQASQDRTINYMRSTVLPLDLNNCTNHVPRLDRFI